MENVNTAGQKQMQGQKNQHADSTQRMRDGNESDQKDISGNKGANSTSQRSGATQVQNYEDYRTSDAGDNNNQSDPVNRQGSNQDKTNQQISDDKSTAGNSKEQDGTIKNQDNSISQQSNDDQKNQEKENGKNASQQGDEKKQQSGVKAQQGNYDDSSKKPSKNPKEDMDDANEMENGTPAMGI